MRISRVRIENFRNFKLLDVALGENVVIVGENKIGKTNFIHALRLVLDPSLPDSARQLQETDFWDGLHPLEEEAMIRITVELKDFEHDDNLLAVLAAHLEKAEPALVASLTYEFDLKNGYQLYGGVSRERVAYDFRKWMPMDILNAIRDVERDLASWKRSPLRPLLERASQDIDKQQLEDIVKNINEASTKIREINKFHQLEGDIDYILTRLVGKRHGSKAKFGIASSDERRLLQTIRLLLGDDDGRPRGVSEESLGVNNVLYLSLRLLELNKKTENKERGHTFFAIEEPEAHLHPHLQRLIYKNLLDSRSHVFSSQEKLLKSGQIFLTTHSPHIASIAPLKSIVLLRRSSLENSTVAVSAANVELDDKDVQDLERYLDVTRGEMLFAKGVILVEGEAEQYLIPVFARLLGLDLDEYGITVCSVGGVHFRPYVKVLSKKGFDIPFAVVTDRDPNKKENKEDSGISRVKILLRDLDVEISDDIDDESLYKLAFDHGIFVNRSTLEIELAQAKIKHLVLTALEEATENTAARKRAASWRENDQSIDQERFMKDLEEIGKGRFAQRLASLVRSQLNELDETYCPDYIKGAILYVKKKVHGFE